MRDSGARGTFKSSRGSEKLGSDSPNRLKDQENSNPIVMAATVRAVFQIALQRTSVRSKSVALKRNAKQRSHRSARPGRSSGKASRLRPGMRRQRREAREGSVSEPPAGREGSSDPHQPSERNRMPARAPVTEPERTSVPHGNDTGRQALFFGKDHALVRVGSTFGSAPFAFGAPSPEFFRGFPERPNPVRRLGRNRRRNQGRHTKAFRFNARGIMVKVP